MLAVFSQCLQGLSCPTLALPPGLLTQLPPLPLLRRPGAAQTCVQKQDHGLETGLDSKLIQVSRGS